MPPVGTPAPANVHVSQHMVRRITTRHDGSWHDVHLHLELLLRLVPLPLPALHLLDLCTFNTVRNHRAASSRYRNGDRYATSSRRHSEHDAN